jgi:hypothetical protein
LNGSGIPLQRIERIRAIGDAVKLLQQRRHALSRVARTLGLAKEAIDRPFDRAGLGEAGRLGELLNLPDHDGVCDLKVHCRLLRQTVRPTRTAHLSAAHRNLVPELAPAPLARPASQLIEP